MGANLEKTKVPCWSAKSQMEAHQVAGARPKTVEGMERHDILIHFSSIVRQCTPKHENIVLVQQLFQFPRIEVDKTAKNPLTYDLMV